MPDNEDDDQELIDQQLPEESNLDKSVYKSQN